MKAGNTDRVLVTGASSGIGLAIAHEFARRGHPLLLVARREDKLRSESRGLVDAYGVDVRILAADLSAPDAPRTVFDFARLLEPSVTVLVNNAGFAAYGPFSESDPDREVNMVRLNVEALLHLTRLFLPGFLERDRGGVLNVASTAAFQPGPYMATYFATKAFVLTFSEALADETRGSSITVSVLCPGPTPTEFQERAAVQQSRLLNLGRLDADTVALAAVRGFLRGKRVVIPGMFNRIGAFAPRLVPRSLATAIVRRLQTPR